MYYLKTAIFLSIISIAGCAVTRKWDLPTEGVVSKSPEILSKCLNDTFLENKIKNKLTVDQRLTKSNSGEITWDQLDSGKSIIHRIVISDSKNGTSNYRVDAGLLGLTGLGHIDGCFK